MGVATEPWLNSSVKIAVITRTEIVLDYVHVLPSLGSHRSCSSFHWKKTKAQSYLACDIVGSEKVLGLVKASLYFVVTISVRTRYLYFKAFHINKVTGRCEVQEGSQVG
jgi:hypothetical protein